MPLHSRADAVKVVVRGSSGNDDTGVGGSVDRDDDVSSVGSAFVGRVVAIVSFCPGEDELEWRSYAFQHVRRGIADI